MAKNGGAKTKRKFTPHRTCKYCKQARRTCTSFRFSRESVSHFLNKLIFLFVHFYLSFNFTFRIEDDDRIEQDLSRTGLTQKNNNCVIQ